MAKTGHGKKIVSGLNSSGRRHRVRQSNYLEEHLTVGELAGRVPSSLLVNIDFQKFSKENGFEPVDQTQSLKLDKQPTSTTNLN